MRKSLFNTRRKLFSTNEGGIIFRDLICKDCGHVLHTAETPSNVICPNCGGKRMDIKLFESSSTVSEVEEKEFSKSILNTFELNLKEYSGKTLSNEDFQKTFSDRSEELFEKGFAERVDNNINISKDAFELQRLFSKLTISVTKTLELDPSIINGDLEKEDIINKLEDNNELPKKGIIIIKKAHGISPEPRIFSDSESWVEDSSIIPDLELEYNNKSFGIEQFIKILRNRYPDAPDNIIDILVESGVLIVDGSQVTIHKK